MTLFTVGHGTRTLDELTALLTEAGIGRLADVRRFPGSRRHPHLGRASLEEALPAAGIAYEWEGEELGGRRSRRPDTRHTAWRNAAFAGYADHMDTPGFRAAFARLLERAEAGPPTAVMCSETVWWRCHRRLLADAALLQGVDVVHVMGPGQRAAHPLHEDARPGNDGWPVYDGGQPQLR